ncbi:hypothetical protein [Kitasatospora sp. Ki12]
MRFLEESGRRSRTYDFAKFKVTPVMQQWLARSFSRRVGTARTSSKRFRTAEGHFYTASSFANVLADCDPQPTSPDDLTGKHIQAYVECYEGRPVQHDYVKRLRTLLRGDPELPEAAWQALLNVRVKGPEIERPGSYPDADWQAIMTAARRDIRLARERIEAGRRLLARWRAGDPGLSLHQTEVGSLLDNFDRTGELPRTPSGDHTRAVMRAGGFRALAPRLCLTRAEATAFCLLLTGLTQENFGTVATWPAAHFHPGGAREDAELVLIEEAKPRRGPEREHMIAALEDLPADLADLFGASSEEPRLMRSPLRLYQLLLSLTELARRHGGTSAAFASLYLGSGKTGSFWGVGTDASDVLAWARSHGFPAARNAVSGGPPAVDVKRIRQTALERRRHPVAHSRRTLNDLYLNGSRTVQADSRRIVATALRQEVAKARAAQAVPVFTADFIAQARHDLAGAAAQVGLEPQSLKELLGAQRDTVTVGCVDHLASPVAEPGQPCPASFLDCLSCGNARALPHQLPIQLAVRDGILQRRPNLDPALWRARFRDHLQQLEDIIDHYTDAERGKARADLTDDYQHLIDDLLDGRLDLR